jgi:hypothetical protein
MKSWKQLTVILLFAGMAACSTAQSSRDHGEKPTEAPPGGKYQKVSELVALPDFIPGMGTLYVQPDTLPAGPFLAYDRDGRLVSTVYMIPLKDMQKHKDFKNLQANGQKVVATDVMYNAGHPGVPEPHYHIVLWHVAPSKAKLK